MTKKDLIKRIESLKQSVVPNATYGDTEFSNDAVVHGYNEAIDDIIRTIEKLYLDTHPDTEADGFVYCGKCGTLKVF